ncbi:hypothetical protein [Hymenobacter tenuis]
MKQGSASGITSLHDAVADQFRFDASRSRLEVIIWESHENKPIVWSQLIISGIRNKEHIQQVQATIDAILERERRTSLGFRIDEFSRRKQPASEYGISYIANLSIDHFLPLRIEFAKFTLRELDESTFATPMYNIRLLCPTLQQQNYA